jgi:hypothetical protein
MINSKSFGFKNRLMSVQKQPCLNLLRADTEEEIVGILKVEGYWEEPTVWRLFGDRENNFSTIGNQQSRPEAALTEKVVNAIDARLMCECMKGGINPRSEAAPVSIREAVAWFMSGRTIGTRSRTKRGR